MTRTPNITQFALEDYSATNGHRHIDVATAKGRLSNCSYHLRLILAETSPLPCRMVMDFAE